jgi:hypothetical protein
VTNDDQRRSFGICVEAAPWTFSEVGNAASEFLRNKKQEWEEYRSEVTAFELRKNLPVL